MSIPRWEQIALLGPGAITDDELKNLPDHPASQAVRDATRRNLFGPMFRHYMLAATLGGSRIMARDFDGDRDYGEAGFFLRNLPTLPEPAPPAYYDIQLAFVQSMHRISAMHTMPIDLLYYQDRLSTISAEAKMEFGLKPRDSIPEEAMEQIANRVVELSEEDANDTTHTNMRMYRFGSLQLKQLNKKQMDLAIHEEHSVAGGMDAILASMITAGYAAFETLAFDLWIAAVNRFPALATKWAKDPKNEKKNITLAELADREFDLRAGMGDFLRRTRKVTFNSLSDVRTHYKLIFDGEADKCFAPVTELEAAEKIRHLLAHRGGLIDQRFKDDLPDNAKYSSLRVGETIRFDGAEVCGHVAACARSAVNLFCYVNDWSEHHDKKTP